MVGLNAFASAGVIKAQTFIVEPVAAAARAERTTAETPRVPIADAVAVKSARDAANGARAAAFVTPMVKAEQSRVIAEQAVIQRADADAAAKEPAPPQLRDNPPSDAPEILPRLIPASANARIQAMMAALDRMAALTEAPATDEAAEAEGGVAAQKTTPDGLPAAYGEQTAAWQAYANDRTAVVEERAAA